MSRPDDHLRDGPLKRGWHDNAIAPRAFTLVELLVVVSIIGLLMSLLMPSLVSVRQQAKSFLCMDHGRAATVDFRIFADSYAHGYRGDSENLGGRFDAMDFQESLYEVGEFWKSGGIRCETYRRGQKPIICPSGPYGLKRIKDDTWAGYHPYVTPRDHVSYAMNRRLFRAPTLKFGTIPYESPVLLGERILAHPTVPLMFDVDSEAALKAVNFSTAVYVPFFIAPNFLDYDYWYPAMRHRGKVIISFVGGHVISTDDPLACGDCDWEYQPTINGP